MKKTFTILILLAAMICQHQICYSADEWDKSQVAGTRNVSDIDAYMIVNNEAQDRMLANYREGAKLKYLSAATITVESGQVMCSNSGGTIRKMRSNPSDTTVTWADIDQGAEANSTTYYLYAVADADAETFTVTISANSSTPNGISYFKRLGSFYNNSSGNIEQVANDNETMIVATGTVADGGTIALPSGYLQDECKWVSGISSISATDTQAKGLKSMDFSCSTSRVCQTDITTQNWIDGSTNYSFTGTGQYIIICNR